MYYDVDPIEEREHESSFLKDYLSAVVTICDGLSMVIDRNLSEARGLPYGEHTLTTVYDGLDDALGRNGSNYHENETARFLGMVTGAVIDVATFWTLPAGLAVVDGLVTGGRYLVDRIKDYKRT